jgi:hypothetical protein
VNSVPFRGSTNVEMICVVRPNSIVVVVVVERFKYTGSRKLSINRVIITEETLESTFVQQDNVKRLLDERVHESGGNPSSEWLQNISRCTSGQASMIHLSILE